MSVRIKVILVIMLIVLAITASSVVISVSSAQSRILKTLENKMEDMIKMANENITSEISKLIDLTSNISTVVRTTPSNQIMGLGNEIGLTFEGLKDECPYLMSVSVFGSARRGITAHQITTYPPEAEVPDISGKLNNLAYRAFDGKRAVSTIYPLSSEEMVFYVLLPVESPSINDANPNRRIVVVTVNSSFYSSRVESGNVTIVDNTGKIVAAVNNEWVLEQQNFLENAKVKEQKDYLEVAKVIQSMIMGETGTARFTMPDYQTNAKEDYMIAFMPVTQTSTEFDAPVSSDWFLEIASSDIVDTLKSESNIEETSWSLGIITPISASSFYEIRYLLIISGFIFFGLGMIAATFASGVIARPFEIAKALSKAKTMFIANLSHDMRTPLNVIIGYSDLSLTKKGLPKEINENLERIYGTGIRLLGVVNDLLDISNIEAGKFGIMPAEYNLNELINDTVNANLIHIGSKPINFKISPDDNLPIKLIGDGLRLRQVFNNLLSNAFLDTSEGTVEWKISTQKEGEKIWLVSSVSDTGQGIKPEDIDDVFLDYSNQDSSKMRSMKGAGLSLALTKRMTDLMGGTIAVESQVGKGSTFTVWIPQKHVSDNVIGSDETKEIKKFKYIEKRRSDDNAEMERVKLNGKRVLVVDDGPLNLEIAKAMISAYGIEVDCITSGQELIEMVQKAEPRYDTIFLTSFMAGMIGREVLHKIRNEIGSDYSKKVPVIALTTNTVTGNIDMFLKWGFQDVLSKPLDIHRLDNVIRRWVAGEK